MNRKIESDLCRVAENVEDELLRFEGLLDALGRPTTTEKGLTRAGQALEECAACEARLAAHLGSFVAALQQVEKRQQACTERVARAAERLQLRHEERSALRARIAELGARARDIGEPLNAMNEASAAGDAGQLLTSMREVATRLESIIAEATAITSAAKEKDCDDIARDADVLRQQLLNVRKQVLLGESRVASSAPS
jgi:hypothetical protein